jgi:hypothetical protein
MGKPLAHDTVMFYMVDCQCGGEYHESHCYYSITLRIDTL